MRRTQGAVFDPRGRSHRLLPSPGSLQRTLGGITSPSGLAFLWRRLSDLRRTHGVSNFSITQEDLAGIKIPILPQKTQIKIGELVKQAYRESEQSYQFYLQAEQILKDIIMLRLSGIEILVSNSKFIKSGNLSMFSLSRE